MAVKAEPFSKSPRQVPIRALLTWPIMLSVCCYAQLSMLDIAYKAIQPLFFSTPIHLGGLGQTPARIGTTLAAFGLSNGVFQALFFAKLIERWGPRRLYLMGLSAYVILYGMFPIINIVARHGGVHIGVVALVIIQLAMSDDEFTKHANLERRCVMSSVRKP